MHILYHAFNLKMLLYVVSAETLHLYIPFNILRSTTFRTFFFRAEDTAETDFLCHCENILSSYVFICWANFRYKPNAWNIKSRYYTQQWTPDTTHCAICTSHLPRSSSLNSSVLLLFETLVLIFSACQTEILTRILLQLSADDF